MSKLYRGLLILSIVLLQSACVSRYTPLVKINPLSDRCFDYEQFSISLTRQRDQGFSKRATISMASFSVGNGTKKDILYAKYKPVIETIYANFLLSESAVRVFAEVQCHYDINTNWPLLANQQYKQVADIVRGCRYANPADVDMRDCIMAAAKVTKHDSIRDVN